jgi:hypothetical protein
MNGTNQAGGIAGLEGDGPGQSQSGLCPGCTLEPAQVGGVWLFSKTKT